jgi:peptidoglycan/xylan/chitin deacetylase (PgdA/CDA1 family)
VFYLPTGFITEQTKPLWFDIYRVLKKYDPSLAATLGGSGKIKLLPVSELYSRTTEALETIDKNLLDMSDEDVAPMTWDQARDLHDRGHTIGAHSTWHSILPNETFDFAKNDIEESIKVVSSEIGQQCRTFAYPNGNYTSRLSQAALNAGVDTVMTTEPIWVGEHSGNWRLPRIQLFNEHDIKRNLFKLVLAKYGRFLKNPDGTGKIYQLIDRQARKQYKNSH